MHTKPDHSPGNPGTQLTTCLLIWLLALSLLLSQTLGLMHGEIHGGGKTLTTAAAHAVVNQARAQNSLLTAEDGALSSLFSSHKNSADCRLYDQASHGNAALHVVCLALPVLLPSFAVAIYQGEALARWAALFDARGPPLTS